MATRLRRKLKDTNVRPFTVYLPEDLDRWVREQATLHGRTLTEQTIRLIRAGQLVLSSDSEQVA